MNTAVARETWQGHIVNGKFPLLQCVGSSERSVVFRTRLGGEHGQDAAIKLIVADGLDPAEILARWQRAATLSHPHLLRILGSGQCQINSARLIYAVTEFAEECLSQVLPLRPLSNHEAGEMLRPVVDVLSYLHGKGFIHGSIKPSNIMAVNNELKLSSDSVRKVGEFEAGTQRSGIYDAPEAANGAVLPASDIWSLGITLVEALQPKGQARQTATQNQPERSGALEPPFRDIARECLRQNPSDRCTCDFIRRALQPGGSVPTSATPTMAAVTGKKSSPKLSGIAITILLLGTVLIGWKWMSNHRTGAHTANPAAPSEVSAVSKKSSADVSPAVAPAAQSLSNPSTVIERFTPNVSPSARETIQGKVRVTVRVMVNASGEIASATLSSPGPSRYFARVALEASHRWKFKPAIKDGQPTASEWILKYQFGRDGTNIFPELAR